MMKDMCGIDNDFALSALGILLLYLVGLHHIGLLPMCESHRATPYVIKLSPIRASIDAIILW